jgi:ESS family glutamate:Na+ symporter
MTSGMNFWDTGVWSFVLTLTVLFIAMMLANLLRNTIRPIRMLMIPSSVLGGFLLLLADFIYKQIFGTPMLQGSALESLTYHGLGLGFVAMSLRTTEKLHKREHKAASFDAGVTVVSTYLLQAVIGLVLSIALYYILGSFFASGMLLPMGYGQGPGQAYNWGRTYENTYGFINGTSFGLTVAAMGFVSASIGGIIYLNYLRRKGIFKGDIGEGAEEERLSAETITGADEIPLSESMDKFTVQVALVFIAYFMAYVFMKGINAIIETGAMGKFGYNTVQPLLWGFNFLFGTIFALLLKTVLGALKKRGVIQREYTSTSCKRAFRGLCSISWSSLRSPPSISPRSDTPNSLFRLPCSVLRAEL